MMFVVNSKKCERGLLIAVCDTDILGKKFIEGKKVLDLTSDFYKGKEMNSDDVNKIARSAYIMDFVGEKAVKFAIKNCWVEKNNIVVVKKIPHAQCVFMR